MQSNIGHREGQDMREGKRVQTYDGPGVITSVYEDSFYGAGLDGMAYEVRLDSGRVATFDRSRIA
jgi:hypothetical protein